MTPDLIVAVGYGLGSTLMAIKYYWAVLLIVIALGVWSGHPAVRVVALLLPLVTHLAIVLVRNPGELPSAASVVGPLVAAALALSISVAIRRIIARPMSAAEHGGAGG